MQVTQRQYKQAPCDACVWLETGPKTATLNISYAAGLLLWARRAGDRGLSIQSIAAAAACGQWWDWESLALQWRRCQARSQKLNKEEAIPSPYLSLPPLPSKGGPRPPIVARRSGGALSGSGQSPAAKRIWPLENASIVTSLVLLCDGVTCSITGHIARRQLPPRAST